MGKRLPEPFAYEGPVLAADVARRHLAILTARHIELIAGIKALSDMLRAKHSNQHIEAHVNRMIAMAKRDYDDLLINEKAASMFLRACDSDETA